MLLRLLLMNTCSFCFNRYPLVSHQVSKPCRSSAVTFDPETLNLVLVVSTVKNVLHRRSYHSADCDTDHPLVCCKIKLQPKRYHRGKKQGNPRIDVSKLSQPDLVEQFAGRLESELKTSQTGDSATEKWATLQDTMHRTALATFGRKTLKSHD